MTERVLTRQNVFVSVLVFVLRPLALFAAVEQLALLLLQSLKEERGFRFQHADAMCPRVGARRNPTGRLTSNSSQKPCLTLSVASASLLSSRTRLSISAALMRVVFRGCGGGAEKTLQICCVRRANQHLVRPEVPV